MVGATFSYGREVHGGGREAELTVGLLFLHLDAGGRAGVLRRPLPRIRPWHLHHLLLLQRFLLHRARDGTDTRGARTLAAGSRRLRLPSGLGGRARHGAGLFVEKVREDGAILLGAPRLRWRGLSFALDS